MTGPPRDWDKELAEIDRLIAKSPGPPAAPAPQATGGGAAPVRPPPPLVDVPSRRDLLATWFRVLLGVALAVGMTQWPYRHACGWSLVVYFAATGVVLVAGVWGAVAAWRRRLPVPHIISLLVVFWGLALVAGVVLPRIGYASEPATWLCGGR